LNKSGKLEVLIPRSLCDLDDVKNLKVDDENFASVFIAWENGIVSELKPINIENKKPKKILFPRFVETHSHFDKSFTFGDFPNFKSNYQEALSANLEEHKTRSTTKVIDRAEKSLNLALKNGYRAIRSHVDTYENQDNSIWDELFKLKKKIFYQVEVTVCSISLVGILGYYSWRGIGKNVF
tara:strand:+ start:161 stop:703 length:543 start_codon:yes stop_codon:yes gene_type:complete